MMSSESASEVSIRSIEVPAHAAASIWASCFRHAKSDCLIIFVVFTFLGLGVAGVAKSLSFIRTSSVYSVGIALACGMLAGVGALLLNFADMPLIRRDLKSGTCVEATVVCEHATRVRLAGSSLEGIALDCGNDTLVLIGDWWLDKTTLDIWENPNCRNRFPAKRFNIRFLPRSGRVLFVRVFEGPISVDEPDPIEPMVSLNCSKYAEVIHVKQKLQSLVVQAG